MNNGKRENNMAPIAKVGRGEAVNNGRTVGCEEWVKDAKKKTFTHSGV